MSLVLDTWKEYKEYREANPGPRTLKSFHTWVRFGGKDRPGFVWKEKMDVKRSKAKKYIQKKEKNKDDKNDKKIKSMFGIGLDGSRKNRQFAIIWMALSNVTLPTAM